MDQQDFRLSLSISPYRMRFADEGVKFTDGEGTARSPMELQQLFNRHGATEMWVRINTRKSGNQHAFENALEPLHIATKPSMPANTALMRAGNYMDMSKQNTVDF